MQQIFVLIILIIFSPLYSAIQIKGIISDKDTGKGLPDANIYIKNSHIGTVSNAEGSYIINVAHLPSVLVVSYIGYQTREIQLTTNLNTPLNIELVPVMLHMEKITVTANSEDPAVSIMKKVIKNKKQWQSGLRSYIAEAYTRNSVSNDSSLIAILETISHVYWDSEMGSREQFLAKKRSEQMGYLAEMNAGSKNILNFMEDDINILNHQFAGPTHPDALAFYHFTLMSESTLDGKIVYRIQVKPRSILQPLFKGEISVLDKEFIMIAVNLENAGNVVFSTMISGFKGRYQQQFRKFNQLFWLPVDSRVEEEFLVDMGTLKFPKARLNKISIISNYRVNTDVSSKITYLDTVKISKYQKKELYQKEQLFSTVNKSPLTKTEQKIIDQPDTSLTLISTFRPTGMMAPLMIKKEDEIEEALRTDSDYSMISSNRKFGVTFRFNRVEELSGTLKIEYLFRNKFNFKLKPGYSTGLKKFDLSCALEYVFNNKNKNQYLFINLFDKTASTYSSSHYADWFTSILPLLGQQDYFDYYRVNGGSLGINAEVRKFKSNVRLFLNFEDGRSLRKISQYNIVNSSFKQRVNPEISEGKINSIKFNYKFAGDFGTPHIEQMIGISSSNFLEFSIEHSSPGLLNSDFKFTHFKLNGDYTINTFLKRRPDSNYLRMRAVLSSHTGILPLQRWINLDGVLLSYSPFGIFKTRYNKPLCGEKTLAVFWEHNFKSIPFEIMGISYFKQQKYEFIIHGASGRTWRAGHNHYENPFYSDKYHHELGASVRLKYNFFGIRLDATQNLSNKHLYLGVSFNLIGLSF